MGTVNRRHAAEQLVVVTVIDIVHPELVKRDSIIYQSPPQTPDQARTLARLLTGGGHGPGRNGRWQLPIPGGKRTVAISDRQ